MKAQLLLHDRIDYDDGGIVELVIWRVSDAGASGEHRLKSSLFYGRPGIREVG
jgi:hypothetical protein